MKFGLEFIKKLNPVKFLFKAPLNDGRQHFGFIAQEVNELANKEDYDFVTAKKLFRNGENSQFLAINYQEFIAPIVKAIQELDYKVESHNINAQLVKEINDLTERLDKLERK